MALIKADRVKETTTTTGTGSFTLNGAVAGYRAFSNAMATGDNCFYTAINPATNEWECGYGTFTAPSTLDRTRIHRSSTGGNSPINFGAGVKEVFISVTARQTHVGEYPSYNPTAVPSVYLSSSGQFASPPQVFTIRAFDTVANVAIGLNPFRYAALTAGVSTNIAIGANALINIGSSSTITNSSNDNIAIGTAAGGRLFSGSRNIMLGSPGGSPNSGEYNLNDCTLIGCDSVVLGISDTNSIVIGANAIGNGSNTTTIGHTDITDCYIRGHLHPSGAVRPASIADASAPTNAIYFSSTANKLVYKDASGTVNNLY